MKLIRSLIRITGMTALILGALICLVKSYLPPEPRVAVGGFGRLGGLENGVWIALGDDTFDSMIDAENISVAKDSGAALYRLAKAGKVKFYAIRTPVRVTDARIGRLAVSVTGGPDAGDWGWVQTEFVQAR